MELIDIGICIKRKENMTFDMLMNEYLLFKDAINKGNVTQVESVD